MTVDYLPATESSGNLVSREAIDMVRTRYEFARAHSAGRRVLELGCGPGAGLPYVGEVAARVTGADITERLLQIARATHGPICPLVRLDAHRLPFADGSVDVILLFESIYYLRDLRHVAAECGRVLSAGGQLLIVTANPERPGFIPSPWSVRYWSSGELAELLRSEGFDVSLMGAFPIDRGPRAAAISAARRVAATLHLMPKSMDGKAWLKRLVVGQLIPFPARVSSATGVVHPLAPIGAAGNLARQFKTYYAVASKRAASIQGSGDVKAS